MYLGQSFRFLTISFAILSIIASVGLCNGWEQASTTMAVIIPSRIVATLESSYAVKAGKQWDLPITVQTRTENSADSGSILLEFQDQSENVVGQLTCRLGNEVLHCAPTLSSQPEKAIDPFTASQATVTISKI